MKFLAVFVALVAAASALTPTTVWTQQELEEALVSPYTDYLLIPFLANAHAEMLAAQQAGQPMDTITVVMPIIASFTLNELSEALQNPETNPAHIPYLEAALNELMTAIMSGVDQQFVTVAIPADLPAPVAQPPVIPELVPSPVEVPAAVPASSPLVQIIVNVQNQQQQVDAVSPVIEAAVPEIIPTPVNVVEEAFVPELVIPSPQPVINFPFNPVDLLPIAPINPAPVIVEPL